MLEITFIAYFLSLISVAFNIWLWNEVKELKQQRKREQVNKRLNAVIKSVQPVKRGPWG